MKKFAFIAASAFVLAAIHAYAAPTYGGPTSASAGFDLNSVQVSIAPFLFAGGTGARRGNVCGNGIGNIGYCNDIEFRNDIEYRRPVTLAPRINGVGP